MSIRVPGRNEDDLTKFAGALEELAQGRVNCTGTFTLAGGATTTTVKFPTVAPGSIILLSPQSANAAGALATTFILPANVTAGQFIVSHANAGTTDRTFGFAAFG